MIEYDLTERINNLRLKVMESEVKYQITQEKDKSLKSLFEVKSQFIQLIKTFVKESWTDKLTEENVELADKDFIMTNMHETRADLVYRIKNEDVYFILLEFQSTKDCNMPYRLLSYILEIWRRYENGKLPVVIPCVLYTGNVKWNVKTLRSLFDVNKEIEKYIPNFEYVLIDVNNYTDKELIETANLVSSVVYMAKSKNNKEVSEKLKNIINLIGNLTEKEQNAFVRWAEGMFYKCGNVYEYFEEELYKREADNMMLADLMPGALEIIREEARVEARKEGKKEGKNIERREQLKRLLTKKLKYEPSKNILLLIEKATDDNIDKLEDKIFEIMTWEEVEDIIKN